MPRIADLVHEVSTSTGSSDFTLSNLNGRRSFSSAFGTGSTTNVFWYAIINRSAAEYEQGVGHMSGSATLVRDTVILSSNANSLVNFSAGAKDVTAAPPTSQYRERLTADRTYFINSSTGNDNNTGLSSSVPFATIQKGVDTAAFSLDLAGKNVLIEVADGTYNEAVSLRGFTSPGDGNGGTISLYGASGTPASCIINSTTGASIGAGIGCAQYYVGGFKLTSSSGYGMFVQEGAQLTVGFFGDMEFGTCALDHINVLNNAILSWGANYTISGGAANHIAVASGSTVKMGAGITVTLTGTPTFSSAFASSNGCSQLIASGNTYSGAANGIRYLAANNGWIHTGTGPPPSGTYFPGSVAGSGTNSGASPWGLYT